MKEELKKGKIGAMVKHICDIYNLNELEVKANLVTTFPELKEKSKCPNCDARMVINVYRADVLNGLLLLKCAEEVQHRLNKGIPFTVANMVHVPSLPTTDAVRRRSSQLDKLNYIKQPADKTRTGFYVITNWGWKALRGERVPSWVSVWRGEIMERSEETTTLGDMFRTHTDKVRKMVEMRKRIEADYREDVRKYSPVDWSEEAGYHEGRLL